MRYVLHGVGLVVTTVAAFVLGMHVAAPVASPTWPLHDPCKPTEVIMWGDQGHSICFPQSRIRIVSLGGHTNR